MKAEEPSYYSYLSYVTLWEAWVETKTQLGVWLVASVFFVAVGRLGVFGADAFQSLAGDDFPQWLGWVIAWCCYCWMMRGEELRIRFPKLTFSQWLVFSVLVLLAAWAIAVLPYWASSPLWLGLFVGAGAIDELVRKGRENYLDFHAPANMDIAD